MSTPDPLVDIYETALAAPLSDVLPKFTAVSTSTVKVAFEVKVKLERAEEPDAKGGTHDFHRLTLTANGTDYVFSAPNAEEAALNAQSGIGQIARALAPDLLA